MPPHEQSSYNRLWCTYYIVFNKINALPLETGTFVQGQAAKAQHKFCVETRAAWCQLNSQERNTLELQSIIHQKCEQDLVGPKVLWEYALFEASYSI